MRLNKNKKKSSSLKEKVVFKNIGNPFCTEKKTILKKKLSMDGCAQNHDPIKAEKKIPFLRANHQLTPE